MNTTSDTYPALIAVEGIIRLETADGGFVGWARLPPFNKAPDILVWGERFFRNRGAFVKGPAAKPEDPHYVLYSEAFSFFLPANMVTSERPAALDPPVKK